jgi:DNA polymerase-3 subunit alpha
MLEALKGSECNLLKLKDMIAQCEKHKKNGDFNGYNYEKFFKISGMPDDMKLRYATKTSEAEYKGLDIYKLLVELKYHGTPMSVGEKIRAQQEYLSYISYVDPNADVRDIVVTNLDTSYSPKFVAYCIKNGETCPMKVRKNKRSHDFSVKTSFKDTPFKDGDVLHMIKAKKEPKAKMVDGEWKRDFTDKEWWLYEYSVISE